ncbi:hypothetical protein ML462_08460 [Gramella lutea]|uniref:Uncharacterized protein n=1 Tax=Christiangramia lutea TaxID=1607951 RepID=A0A9X1V3J0_9FLAO|nr:hypothetical protein [Christiangramia lutea]MCH4823205.1 hypothetical protein [Christiangramia lutea]
MLELITREECLNRNKILAAYVQNVQAEVYAPGKNYPLFIPGENYLEEKQKWVELSEEECAERNKPVLEEFEPIRDNIQVVPEIGRFKAETILTTTSDNFEDHISLFGQELSRLDQNLGWGGIQFIMDFPFNWLSSLDTIRDLEALNWFKKMDIEDDFSGAILAGGNDLDVLIRHLLNLRKDNIEFQDISFCGLNAASIGSICKYGNVHYLFYDLQEKEKFDEEIDKTSLEQIPFGACYYQF